MAQQIISSNNLQSTVNFSTVGDGEFFVYGGNNCIRISGTQNPNYCVIGSSHKGKLGNTDQVIYPKKVSYTLL
jgi:hypothetical protein